MHYWEPEIGSASAPWIFMRARMSFYAVHSAFWYKARPAAERLLLVIRVLTLNNWRARYYRCSVDCSALPRLIGSTSNYELLELSVANNSSFPTDLTPQRQNVNILLKWRCPRVTEGDTSEFVDTTGGQFEYNAHRGRVRWRVRARNISRSLPSLRDQRSRSREAYSAELLKYASPTAFTCRDTRRAM